MRATRHRTARCDVESEWMARRCNQKRRKEREREREGMVSFYLCRLCALFWLRKIYYERVMVGRCLGIHSFQSSAGWSTMSLHTGGTMGRRACQVCHAFALASHPFAFIQFKQIRFCRVGLCQHRCRGWQIRGTYAVARAERQYQIYINVLTWRIRTHH